MTSNQTSRKNDLVLVTDENLPRGQWPLGRILDVFPDEDGQVRTVKVRVGTTAKVRPIHKLVLLESNGVEIESNLDTVPDQHD